MKRRTFWIGSVTVLTALAACAAPEPQDTTAADLAAIDGVRSAWATAFAAGDAAALAALYTEDAVRMNPGEPSVSGRAAIQSNFEGVFSEVSGEIEIRPEDTEVGGDIGFESGTFRNTITPNAGGEAMVEEGRYVVAFRRDTDGSWKLVLEMGNSPTPPMTPEGM